MSPNPNRDRRILLVLIILLLVSISYLALQAATYFGGSWQLVSGQGMQLTGGQGRETFSVQLPERTDYLNEDFGAIRTGQLFFKPWNVVEEVVVIPPTPGPVEVEPPKKVEPETKIPDVVTPRELPKEEIIPQPELPKPTCPYTVSGILWGEPPFAILVNQETRKSQTVQVGAVLGHFTVKAIEPDSVLIEGVDAEFKLELGGM